MRGFPAALLFRASAHSIPEIPDAATLHARKPLGAVQETITSADITTSHAHPPRAVHMRRRRALIISSAAAVLVMVASVLAGTAGRSTSPEPTAVNTSIAPLFSATRQVCSPAETSTAPASSPSASQPTETITARMCIAPDATRARMMATLTFRVNTSTKVRRACAIKVQAPDGQPTPVSIRASHGQSAKIPTRADRPHVCAGTLRGHFTPQVGSSMVTASVRHADNSTAVFRFGSLLRES
jgi:hypothetical protein